MKVAINKCFGGFSLSPLATKRILEMEGRPCYFFVQDIKQGLDSDFIPVTTEEAGKALTFYAFTIPNPNEILKNKSWDKLTEEEKRARNELYSAVCPREYERDDLTLVRCIEELGEKANGRCAEIKIVEIPDGVDYQIEEYDGNEHVAEKHRTWG